MVHLKKLCWFVALALSIAGHAVFGHDVSTDYAGEPLVHVAFDGDLSNLGTYPAQPRMVEVGGKPSEPPQFVQGRFGQAMKFEGDRILEVPIDITKEIYPQVTVTGWVYVDADNPDPTGFLVSNNSFLKLQLYGGAYWMATGKHSMVQFGSRVVPKYRWVFFAGVWDSATNQGTAYVDQRVKSGDMTLDTAIEPDRSVWVGASTVSSSSILNGIRIDDLRIYPGALSAAQIRDVWSGSGVPQVSSAKPAPVSSGKTTSTMTAGTGDKGAVYDVDMNEQPITGSSEIEKSLAEGTLSREPSTTSESSGGGGGSDGAAGNQAPQKRVIGWRINVNDRYETEIAGRRMDVVRELDLGSANPGLRRIGWRDDKGAPCRMLIDHSSGANTSWPVQAGTCLFVTGTKSAALNSEYVTELTVKNRGTNTMRQSVDKITIKGFALGDDGERTGGIRVDSTSDASDLTGGTVERVSCRDGYIANGVIAHFTRPAAGNTPVTGLQLICVKVEKLYEQ